LTNPPDGFAGDLAEVVCDSGEKLHQKSVSETKVAWRCEHQGQSVDFDVDASQTAKQTASDDALTLFGANNTLRSWANPPTLCGSEWAMGDGDQANKLETRG